MESSRMLQLKIVILGLQLCVAALFFSGCDARRPMHIVRDDNKHPRSGSIVRQRKRIQISKRLDFFFLIGKRLDVDSAQLADSNAEPYGVSSPFSLPPYESLAPMPLPENTPPFCVYPPFTSQAPPSTTIPFPPPSGGSGGGGGGGGYTPSLPPPSSSTPALPFLSPPPSPVGLGGGVPSPPQSIPSPIPNPSPAGLGGGVPSPPQSIPSPIPPNPSPAGLGGGVPSPPQSIPSPIPNPPEFVPSPPTYVVPSPPGSEVPGAPTTVPSPTQPVLSPPYYFEPTPPSTAVPSPPFGVPSIFVPSPPVFQPPVVYPPPMVPPPPRTTPFSALWCVSKPTVPDPIIQEAMNYACASGADCDSIQPNGSCFQPNTLFAHASYAFNSYWQRNKVAGGTCEFGGTAMLITVDPSHDGCHFDYA